LPPRRAPRRIDREPRHVTRRRSGNKDRSSSSLNFGMRNTLSPGRQTRDRRLDDEVRLLSITGRAVQDVLVRNRT
jgi:hypothetical protein